MCGVARHAQDTPERVDGAPSPQNDVSELHNEQVVCAPDDNYRNPSEGGCHLSVLLRSVQVFKKLLSKLVLLPTISIE